MAKKVTVREIADKAGVALGTVSRVLNNQASRYRIKEETVTKVIHSAKALQYDPVLLSADFRISKSNSIGLIVPDISNPFYASMIQRVEIESRKNGYFMMLCDSLRDITREKENIKLLLNRRVDGLIIATMGTDSSHIDRIIEKGSKVVLVDRYFTNMKCPYVVSDNYTGAFDAVNWLIEQGHQSIGCIQGVHHTSVNNERLKGYSDALKSYSLAVDESLVVGNAFTESNGYVNTKILLNRKKKPTAIFAFNNLISVGTLSAILEDGMMIPDDISLITFDDYQPYMGVIDPPLTVICQQTEEIGHIALKLLLDQIESNGQLDISNVILPTRFIKRKSVKNIS